MATKQMILEQKKRERHAKRRIEAKARFQRHMNGLKQEQKQKWLSFLNMLNWLKTQKKGNTNNASE